jgi:glycosyltransferase involved in cell wall biosynthesis
MFSVIIPAKNEEKNLSRCLQSLQSCDDVIVVDSGSADQTPAIAAAAGRQVVQFSWDGKFPKKRNWALQNIPLKHDWVLFLDADEFVSDAFLAEIRATLSTTTHTGFWLTYNQYFLGKLLKHGDPLRKLALFRRSCGQYEEIREEQWSRLDMEVHEHPVLSGTQGTIATFIDHNDYKGLHAYIQRHNEYSTWEANRYINLLQNPEQWNRLTSRQKTKYKNLPRWWFPLAYFLVSWGLKRGFLDGRAGFVFWVHKLMYFWQIRIKIGEQTAKLRSNNHTDSHASIH